VRHGILWWLGLIINSIDARSTPRLVWFVLRKDGVQKDEKYYPGQIYTYVEQNLAGETNVPVLVTYIGGIFSGNTSDMLQFRYTWAIDTNVTEINPGDIFGIFTTTKAEESIIELEKLNESV